MNQTTMRIAEPRELLAFLPYQLGFQPQESAVIVSLRGPRSRVGLVARVDLADLAAEHGAEMARMLLGHLVRDGARRCVLVLYTAADLQGAPGVSGQAAGGGLPPEVPDGSDNVPAVAPRRADDLGRADDVSRADDLGPADDVSRADDLGPPNDLRAANGLRAANRLRTPNDLRAANDRRQVDDRSPGGVLSPATVRRAVETFCRVMEPALGDVIRWAVGPTGYYVPGCQDRSCCPAGGRALSDLQSTTVSARMVLAGANVLDDRAEIGRIPRAPGSERRKAFRAADRATANAGKAAAAGELALWRAEALATWREQLDRALRTPGSWTCPPARCGRLQAALGDVIVRDAVLLTLVPGTGDSPDACVRDGGAAQVGAALRPVFDPVAGQRPDPELAAAGRLVLEQVVAHAREDGCAPPLTLLAMLAWWDGDGARASALVERALAADGEHRLAQLIADVIAAGLAPGWARRAAERDSMTMR